MESLVAFCAITQVVLAVERLPWIAGSFYPEPDPSHPGLMLWVPGSPYWWWKGSALTAGVTAMAIVYVRRTARTAWAESYLIGVGLAALLLFTDQAIQFWADAAPPPSLIAPLIAIHAAQLVGGTVLSSLIVNRVGYA